MAPESFAQRVQRIGFKRWYERQLLSSHAHLVLCLLALLGLMGALEAYTRVAQDWADKLVDLAAVAGCAAIGLWALRQYLQRIAQAEFVANQANCPDCGHYARWTCVQAQTDSLDVACKDCDRRWRIEA
jgi:predicted RNA-binding Zn-ribbon protein involved in translation (DUF1610 family)